MTSCSPVMVITFVIIVGYQPVASIKSGSDATGRDAPSGVSCAAIRSVSRPVCSTVLCGSRRKLSGHLWLRRKL